MYVYKQGAPREGGVELVYPGITKVHRLLLVLSGNWFPSQFPPLILALTQGQIAGTSSTDKIITMNILSLFI